MNRRTVALLHPGEMGAAIGRCLMERGHRVTWTAQGRSAETRALADALGLELRDSLPAVLADAEIALSVCPPHAALALAEAVAGAGFRGLYADANAIASGTARAVGGCIEAAGGRFVDGSIVGPPPEGGKGARLFLSGPEAETIAALFAGTATEPVVLAGPPGAASAVKMCYAAWTKGATALLADIRALAEAEGVEAALLAEWQRSQPDLPERSEAITRQARKAWRWISEMEEIAASFAAVGLPDGFHKGAADLYARLQGFKDRKAPPLADVIRALRRQP